jgi:alpha-L-fucosidase
MRILQDITDWMAVNGEGIHATRPWKIKGEGPAMAIAVDPNARFNEGVQPDLGAQDIRFTTKGATLFAFVQGWPQGGVTIRALGTASPQASVRVADVRLLGRDQALSFTQGFEALRVVLPAEKPATADVGIALRIRFA